MYLLGLLACLACCQPPLVFDPESTPVFAPDDDHLAALAQAIGRGAPSPNLMREVRTVLARRWRMNRLETCSFPIVALHATTPSHVAWIDSVCKEALGRKATTVEVVELSMPCDATPFDSALWRRILRRRNDAALLNAAGVVVDAVGRPIEGAQVVESSSGETATTDAEGKFSLTFKPSEAMRHEPSLERSIALEVSRMGFAGMVVRPPLTPPKGLTRISVSLKVHPPVGGELIDEDGRPVGFAGIHFLAGAQDGTASMTADSDVHGVFRLPAWPQWDTLNRVQMLHSAFVAEPIEVAKTGNAHLFRWKFRRGCRVAGRVRDPAGAPVPLAQVELRPYSGGRGVVTYTSPAGEFEFRNAPAGKCLLTAASRTHCIVGRQVEPSASEPLEGLEISLSTGKTITGRVLLPNGGPAPFAAVSTLDVHSADGIRRRSQAATREVRTAADADGRFTLGPLNPDEQFPLEASWRHPKDGSLYGEMLGVDAGDQNARLVLEEPASVPPVDPKEISRPRVPRGRADDDARKP